MAKPGIIQPYAVGGLHKPLGGLAYHGLAKHLLFIAPPYLLDYSNPGGEHWYFIQIWGYGIAERGVAIFAFPGVFTFAAPGFLLNAGHFLLRFAVCSWAAFLLPGLAFSFRNPSRQAPRAFPFR